MNGRCDAASCNAKARWYAVGRWRKGQELVRAVFNVSACDAHQQLTVLELSRGAGFDGIVNNLLARAEAGFEVQWEHIVGA